MPRWLRLTVPQETDAQIAMCRQHDRAYYYGGSPADRRHADYLLWFHMRMTGMPQWKAWSYWAAVRIGGHPAFGKKGTSWAHGGERFDYTAAPAAPPAPDEAVMPDRPGGLIQWFLNLFRCRHHTEAVRIAVYDDGKETRMGKPLANVNTRALILVPKGPSGRRDDVQKGTMKAVSADPSVASIALDPTDEFKAIITPVDGALSPSADFTFSADADLGDGVVEITGTYSCSIVAEQASVIDPQEGVDTPKP